MLGSEYVREPAEVRCGRIVIFTPPDKLTYFSVTEPVRSVMKPGESPEAV